MPLADSAIMAPRCGVSAFDSLGADEGDVAAHGFTLFGAEAVLIWVVAKGFRDLDRHRTLEVGGRFGYAVVGSKLAEEVQRGLGLEALEQTTVDEDSVARSFDHEPGTGDDLGGAPENNPHVRSSCCLFGW